MKKSESPNLSAKTTTTKSRKMTQKKKEIKSMQEIKDGLKKQIESLSYEESMRQLDELISNLQGENVSVEELQIYYLKGNIYLEHCDSLLKRTEQEILEFENANIKAED